MEGESASRKKLMILVRHNPQSALTRRNAVEILQDAETWRPPFTAVGITVAAAVGKSPGLLDSRDAAGASPAARRGSARWLGSGGRGLALQPEQAASA